MRHNGADRKPRLRYTGGQKPTQSACLSIRIRYREALIGSHRFWADMSWFRPSEHSSILYGRTLLLLWLSEDGENEHILICRRFPCKNLENTYQRWENWSRYHVLVWGQMFLIFRISRNYSYDFTTEQIPPIQFKNIN